MTVATSKVANITASLDGNCQKQIYVSKIKEDPAAAINDDYFVNPLLAGQSPECRR
jgi:hypothetical protein